MTTEVSESIPLTKNDMDRLYDITMTMHGVVGLLKGGDVTTDVIEHFAMRADRELTDLYVEILERVGPKGGAQ